MSKLEQIKALAAQQAAVSENMNEVAKGGGSRLIPKGRYLGRVVEYIDCGQQVQEFQGKTKDPAPEFRLGIALWGDGVSEPDGTPYVLRPFPLALSRFERSTAYKAFKAMNWQGDPTITHFAQFLGMPFIFAIDHHTSKAGKVSSIIKWELTTGAVDVVSGQPYNVPEVPDDMYRVFLWDFPTLEAWDSLHIEGTNEDGKSMNFVQEHILGALNFKGSPLEQLFLQTGKPVPAVQAPAQAPNLAIPDQSPTPPDQTPSALVTQAAVPQGFTTPGSVPSAVTTPADVTAHSAGVSPAAGVQVPVPTAPAQTSVPQAGVTSPSNPAVVTLPSLPAL